MTEDTRLAEALRHIAAYGTDPKYPEVEGAEDASSGMAELAQAALDADDDRPEDRDWQAYNNKEDGWLVYDQSLDTSQRYSYPLGFKTKEPPIVPSEDRLDALYDAALGVLDKALMLNANFNPMEKSQWASQADIALGTIDRWLARREADRQYALQKGNN